MSNDAAATDDSTFPNRHACHNLYVTSNPSLIANGNTTSDESSLSTFLGIKAVVGTIYTYVWSNQYVVPDADA